MTIYFGLGLDDVVFPKPLQTTGSQHYLGPQGILYTLESHLGLIGHPPENEYLRIEQYRQALQIYLLQRPEVFFKASFEADQFATATELLSRRDELLLAGWDFVEFNDIPARLKCLTELESLFDGNNRKLSAGYADRFMMVLQKMENRHQPFSKIYLNEPFYLLPAHFQRLFKKMESLGVQLLQLSASEPMGDSDLAVFQKSLINVPGFENLPYLKSKLNGDGSLLLLRGKRETDLAAFVAKLTRRNASFRPLCLIPGKHRILDQVLVQEGLPSMGIPSASLARPTLQVLKLVTVFLWNPIDPFKIMEFVSLAIKPLEDDLSNRIAVQMAQIPGINSDSWFAMIARYFEDIERRAATDSSIDVNEIRFQYRFWFERRRYDISKTVPKEDVIQVFAYLHHWSRQQFENGSSKNNSLLVLTEQAKRIADLMETLPETQLSNLELERIVRTIYEPAPVNFQEQELGFLPYIHTPNTLIDNTATLLWFNFSESEPVHFFSKWYHSERNYLEKLGIRLRTPEDENALLIWQRRQPVLRTHQSLILVMPQMIDGKEVHPHPLLGNLEATFANLDDITFDIDTELGKTAFAQFFDLPKKTTLQHRRLGAPRPFLHIRAAERLGQREEETFSSLEALFYYPYQWIFRHKIKLSKSSILSIVKDNALMGNLAHRFFEQLFQQDIQSLNKTELERWIDTEANRLLSREGAVLLMYGREPERVAFIKKVKFAAWSLLDVLRKNGWKVLQTEKSLEGKFLNIPINGRADLVLEKNGELAVIDLKWRGAKRREETIRNEEDLQLVLYSKLLTDDHTWAHTAYFVMENGKLIARNNEAFQEANGVAPNSSLVEAHERILQKMQATYEWRIQQIQEGKVEIRCKQTQILLEEAYGGALLRVLEMKNEDAPFDDYRTLINLID
ncbi:MAG: PD-(D/E)XK nuclease family protein [Saprospiraceae bacterium]|nr:PD-(D/E)XK nuclease family protein [Saprospiraceae bacterium]